MDRQSRTNSNTAVIHYDANVERKSNENDLVMLVRESRNEMASDGELNVVLRDFATDLLKRRLIRKVEFLRAMDFSPAGVEDANSIQTHSSATGRKSLASFHDAIVMVNAKIMTLTSRVLIGLKPVKVNLLREYETLAKMARSVADKSRRLREERREREKNFQKLLTTSLDAIVVINGDRRFVTANARALDLFGISERNITMFTIDAFLPHRQIVEFDEHVRFLMNGKEREGKCEIKPLKGSLLVARYTLVPNIVPGRSLYRFRELAQGEANRLGCGPKIPASYSPRHWAITRVPARASQS